MHKKACPYIYKNLLMHGLCSILQKACLSGGEQINRNKETRSKGIPCKDIPKMSFIFKCGIPEEAKLFRLPQEF